jgi:hypothetical protein
MNKTMVIDRLEEIGRTMGYIPKSKGAKRKTSGVDLPKAKDTKRKTSGVLKGEECGTLEEMGRQMGYTFQSKITRRKTSGVDPPKSKDTNQKTLSVLKDEECKTLEEIGRQMGYAVQSTSTRRKTSGVPICEKKNIAKIKGHPKLRDFMSDRATSVLKQPPPKPMCKKKNKKATIKGQPKLLDFMKIRATNTTIKGLTTSASGDININTKPIVPYFGHVNENEYNEECKTQSRLFTDICSESDLNFHKRETNIIRDFIASKNDKSCNVEKVLLLNAGNGVGKSYCLRQACPKAELLYFDGNKPNLSHHMREILVKVRHSNLTICVIDQPELQEPEELGKLFSFMQNLINPYENLRGRAKGKVSIKFVMNPVVILTTNRFHEKLIIHLYKVKPSKEITIPCLNSFQKRALILKIANHNLSDVDILQSTGDITHLLTTTQFNLMEQSTASKGSKCSKDLLQLDLFTATRVLLQPTEGIDFDKYQSIWDLKIGEKKLFKTLYNSYTNFAPSKYVPDTHDVMNELSMSLSDYEAFQFTGAGKVFKDCLQRRFHYEYSKPFVRPKRMFIDVKSPGPNTFFNLPAHFHLYRIDTDTARYVSMMNQMEFKKKQKDMDYQITGEYNLSKHIGKYRRLIDENKSIYGIFDIFDSDVQIDKKSKKAPEDARKLNIIKYLSHTFTGSNGN